MNKRERVMAALRREPTDRTPYALWRHFPAVDRSPGGLAQATLRFHDRYGSDFLKVTPTGGYAVEDWGCVEGSEVAVDGHRPCVRHAVNAPEDWKKIRPLPITSNGWGAHLETIIRCVVDLRADCFVLPTLFSPLSLARKLSGARLAYDLVENTQAVLDALEVIAEMDIALARACLDEGAEGIFYSVQAASASLHSREEYARFGEPYDRRVLESVRGRAKLTVLHGHGDHLMFDALAALPADAWNWDDRRHGPSLEAAAAQVPGAVIGGLDQWVTLREGTGEAVKAEARDAVAQTGGRGLIVGPGCVVQMNTPDGNLVDLATALGGSVKLAGIKPQW
ncbi:MAG: uroporphyrinogen decarboxylase [Candidatus Rokubacteria bacterium]|nr:uroporphyrinogen decarboxylase [Candidatus Rokubacteria bacterium]